MSDKTTLKAAPSAPAPVHEEKKTVIKSEHKVKYHNIIISLIALLILPVYLYGLRVLLLLLGGLVTAVLLDFLFARVILRSSHMKYDYSGIVTALIVVMLMPATVPVWVVCVSVFIGMCVAKYPFGGVGHNIFNPAAVGVAFSALSWPELVMKYPVPYTTYSIFGGGEAIQYAISPASTLRVGGTPKIDFFDILLGKFAGPLGATCVIVLTACAIYLLLRSVISKRIVFTALFVVAAFAFLFPRVMTGRIDSLIYELSSGAVIFCIVFMSGDPTTTPNTAGGRLFYGVLLGAAIMMFRYFGKMELSEVYAVLFVNVFAGSCDRYANYLSQRFGKEKRKKVVAEIAAELDIQEAGGTDA